MNKQERRRLEIKKKDPMVSIKQSDIDRMKEEATEKGCKMAFNLMLAVPAMVIHDKFGSLMKKEGRVEKFVDLCMEEYKCYEEGYVRLDEMAKILKEEAGVEIEGWH
ncbi:hypothetical protein [Dialister hominis]|uniref:hypothetical protein n=1 Tax=Dialister hominis TaxID=2582419 RepID=UPI003521B76F